MCGVVEMWLSYLKRKDKRLAIQGLNEAGYGLFEIKYYLENGKPFPCRIKKLKEK